MAIKWRLAVFAIFSGVLAAQAGQRVSTARPSAQVPADPGWSALMGSMEQMDTAMMSVTQSGDGDADFVQLMLPHHQAAIDMAKAQLRYGKDPQMRRLAQEIITDQQSEIELMQLWLKQHQSGPLLMKDQLMKDQTPAVHPGRD
jgi:uncharacterized protein (DUF305 family)